MIEVVDNEESLGGFGGGGEYIGSSSGENNFPPINVDVDLPPMNVGGSRHRRRHRGHSKKSKRKSKMHRCKPMRSKKRKSRRGKSLRRKSMRRR